MKSHGRVLVGTSGWHYSHWKGLFYPEKCPSRLFLDEYLKHFDTAEINNSFYQLPKEDTLRQWVATTPPGFVFCVKASRYITHMKKLGDPQTTLPPFLDRVALLGEKAGPVLFLVPPKFGYNEAKLKAFLAALPAGVQGAFELRDPSWRNPAAHDLLLASGHAVVLVDLKGQLSPLVEGSGFMYVRFHGATDHGFGRYDKALLRDRAAMLQDWTGKGKTVYAYFDNDDAAAAPLDAMQLKELLAR